MVSDISGTEGGRDVTKGKLSKREKAALTVAAKEIAVYGGWSCIEVRRAGGCGLRDMYAWFYDKHPEFGWGISAGPYPDKTQDGWRILLILLFREVGLNGIGEE
jgi:hypothetical protein